MAFKLIESAQARWRTVNARHLVALVRAGAKFERGTSSSDPTDQEVISKSPDTPIHRSPMILTGTPSHTQHNEPTERAIQ
jgi:hypothetical protein